MLKEILEGKTRLLVPGEGGVFYNPRSKLSRSVGCAVVSAIAKREKISFLDLLSASGARGIRIAKETGCHVHLNDADPRAEELMAKNLEINGLDASVSIAEANLFLRSNPGAFDFIDIDPFGSPAPFLESAIATSRRAGYLAFAATDTAVLCGTHARACIKRYSALPLRCEFCHEVGVRILVGYAARLAIAHGLGISCLLANATEHYMRVYLHLTSGRGAADRTLGDMGYLHYCRNCLEREHERTLIPYKKKCTCGGELIPAGPLWLGPIKDSIFCTEALTEASYLHDPELDSLLSTLAEEVEAPFYFDVHAISRKMRSSARPMKVIMEALSGHKISRTHFSPTGIKTDATLSEVKRALLPILFFLAVFAQAFHRITAVVAERGAALLALV